MTERSRSFGAVAAAYARYRPGYPAAALDWALAPTPRRRGARPRRGHRQGHRGAAAAARRARDGGGSRPRDARPVPRRLPHGRRLRGHRRADPAPGRRGGRRRRRHGVALVRPGARRARDRAGAAARRRARRALERRRRHGRMGARLPPRAAPRAQPPAVGTTLAEARPRDPAFGAVRDPPVRQPGAHHDRRLRRDHRHALLGPDRRPRPSATPPSPGCAPTWRRGPRRRRARSRCPWSPTSCARCAGRPAAARARSGRERAR